MITVASTSSNRITFLIGSSLVIRGLTEYVDKSLSVFNAKRLQLSVLSFILLASCFYSLKLSVVWHIACYEIN